MNRVEIKGGLTRDAEYRLVGARNTPLLEMTVAVNGTRYDAERREQVVKTTFVTVQAWGYVGEHLTNLHGSLGKGDEVYVLGELDQHEVEKQDGTKDRKTRVTALHIDVLRSRSHQASHGGASAAPTGSHLSDEPPF